MDEIEKRLDTLSGQIAALRTVVVATAFLEPRKAALRQTVEELLQHQRETLLAHPVSEEFLAGLDLAGEEMLSLLQPNDEQLP